MFTILLIGVTRYSGLDAVSVLAFTSTGWSYPFFGTFLGELGVALTGSDTSANALFGSLQRITSRQLGIDPILMCRGQQRRSREGENGGRSVHHDRNRRHRTGGQWRNHLARYTIGHSPVNYSGLIWL